MRHLMIYADPSVIGGCEDDQCADDSEALWAEFVKGTHTLGPFCQHTP